MKLYYTPGYCSLAVHIALREAGAEFALEKVDTASPEFRAINPRGYVPVLELDDGSRHTEAAALLQYVGDLAPGKGLMPAAGSRARFEALQWLTFISSELHKQFSPWLFHKETADTTRKAVQDKIAARLAELDARLARREWLLGGTFSVADAYLFAIVNWAPWVGLSLKAYPALAAYMDRVRSRSQVRAALEAEGLK
ncbi:glutathione transferase GstA [Ramlibacter solisilvae]|uniref:Glutathione S-transferase n=1 Tax=Ramlibacter tataouinensis TaxID=94132 RepID=A0A127JU09_9BURK|nr:glutathione transferase GstA [Ramlibacter tataouinensis]AMO23383.1 glutathione S-transferase [Ramlibacter tataouinensis]